ncbi:MAG: hypothetical protein RLZZ543_1002 [Bacteroidota bacterium]|jgi:hypothetical protein
MENFPELRFLPHAKINKVRWDQALKECANGLAYASTWYLDAVTNDNWDALVSDDYTWMMPLPMKKKAGFSYLPTPLFVQQLGIFGPGPFTAELTEHFLKHIEANIKLVEFQLNANNPAPQNGVFEIKQRLNHLLYLPEDKSTLLKGYSENTARNIKKAEKAGIRFGTASIRQMIKLFQDHKEHEIENWKIDNYNVLDRLYNVCMLRKFGDSLGVYNSNGELIAGAFITEWKDRATFVFSCNSPEGKENGALPALIHHYLMNAPEKIKLFDFEGSDQEGLARFYKSFGSIESNYVHLKLNRLPFYMRWLKP